MKNSKYSKTAMLIAMAICLLAKEATLEKMVNNQRLLHAVKFIKSQGVLGKLFVFLANFRFFRLMCFKMEGVVLPGVLLHFLARKKMIDQLIESEIDSGSEQVAILGAGFDGLSDLLVHRFPELTVFTLDHPATYSQLETNKTSDIKTIKLACEIGVNDVTKSLVDGGFDPKKKTVFLAEGLLMYLQEQVVRSLFDELSIISRVPSTFVFTSMKKQKDGKIDFVNSSRWLIRWLKKNKESFTWGANDKEISTLLASTNWKLVQSFQEKKLATQILFKNGLKDKRLVEGEWIYMAKTVH